MAQWFLGTFYIGRAAQKTSASDLSYPSKLNIYWPIRDKVGRYPLP